MNKRAGPVDQSFVSLADFEKTGAVMHHPRGNVIKGNIVRVRGSRNIEVDESGPDAPKIVIHKEGDCIEGVEFVCPCGKSASLSFEYEEQTPPSV